MNTTYLNLLRATSVIVFGSVPIACGSVTEGSSNMDASADSTNGATLSGEAGAGGAGKGGAGGAAGLAVSGGTGGASGVGGIGGAAGMAAGGGVAGTTSASGGAGGGVLLLGPNLITNGDFSNGEDGWLPTVPSGSGVTTSATDGQLCVTFPSGTYAEVTIGWPADMAQAVALPAGESFQFSFQVSSAPSLAQFADLVGQVAGLATPNFQSTNDLLFGGIQTFTHTFTSGGDSAAGVAFNLNSLGAAATVCFDNVELQQVDGVSH